MANIFFNPTSLNLPSSKAQDFSVEATYSFAGELPDTQGDLQIGEVSTPEGVTQNSRTLVTSSSQEQVYAYSFHTDANTSQFERAIVLEFSILRTGGEGVLKLYPVSQPGQPTPVTSPSLSLSPAQVRFLSEVSVASVTASMYNTGSTLSLTPTSPSWVTVNPVDSYQQGDAYIKTYLLTASANQSATSRNSFVSFSLNTAGETVNKSVSVTQPGRASIVEPVVTLSTYLYELESEGANVGIVAYVSGTVASNVNVTGDHTPTVEYTTTDGIVTASIQFNVPANTSAVTRSTYMTVSAWNSAGTSSKVLEIRTAGTDTPVLPGGSVTIPGSPYTVESGDQSQQVVVIYSESVGRYTIDTPGYGGGVTSVTEVARQSSGNNTIVTWSVNFPANATTESITRWAVFQMTSGSHVPSKQAFIYQQGRGVVVGSVTVGPYNPQNVASSTTSSPFFVTYSSANSGEYTIKDPVTSSGITSITKSTQSLGSDVYGTYTVGYPANSSTANSVTHSVTFVMSSSNDIKSGVGYVYQAEATPTPSFPGSIVVESGNHITASANANSTNFTVRYVNAEAGQYTIDGAGGFSGMDNPVSQSTIVDGNDVVVTYIAAFPNNLTAEPVTRRAAFQMHRGDEYVYGQADIYQEGVDAPGGAGVIIENSPVVTSPNSSQCFFYVTYSNALQDPWVIQEPVFSNESYLLESASRNSGQDVIRIYSVGHAGNFNNYPITHSVLFQMSYGQYHAENTGYIYQEAATPSPQVSIRCTGSVSRDNYAFAARCWVDYMGVAYPDDVRQPTWNGNITDVVYRGYTPIDGGVKITYDITASANQTSGPVYSVITWSTVYGNVSATTTITQSAGPGPEPGTPEIVVPGNPFNLESGDQIVTFTATYKNSYPGWTVRTAGTNKSDMHIVSSSVQIVGSNQQVTYEVTFLGNAGDLPVERRVFLLMTSGSGESENERKTLDVVITQAGRLQVGSIHLQPSTAWVAASDTQSTFYATYSFNGLAYQIQNPSGYRCTVTTMGSRSLDNGDQVYQYRVTFPTNSSTDTPISRSVDCRMITGSITAIKTYIVAQDYQGGGGSKQILVSPAVKWIEHDQVTATTQVTYMGFSSAAQVGTPSCPSGWTATVGNVQESSGQVTINWIFTGTPNTGSGTKTNTFTIGATGATSKTFTVFQYGTGGGGGGGTENVSPVWKRNLISSSAASSRLRVVYDSQEIFNERVYAAPDSDHVEVDLNKICDPFVTHPDFWAEDDRGYDSVAGYPIYLGLSNYPISRFEASFDSGENYVSYILNDRSYDLIEPYWLSQSVYLNSVSPRTWSGGYDYYLGNNVGLNQINFFVVKNQSASPAALSLSAPGRTATLTVPAKNLGIVWTVARKCGEYSLTFNSRTYSRVVTDSRSKWAVYFWNSLGGLDTLPLYGPVVPSIDVSRNNYLQGIYNYTKSYLNGVVSRWRCNTGTFPDEWAPMVREMIASPEIGLHDLKTDNIYVTRAITNSIEEKTFWNQGRKFATYQFDLESILTQERR